MYIFVRRIYIFMHTHKAHSFFAFFTELSMRYTGVASNPVKNQIQSLHRLLWYITEYRRTVQISPLIIVIQYKKSKTV